MARKWAPMFAMMALLSATAIAHGTVLTVENHSVPHGTVWPGHYHTIGEAITAAAAGDQVWVAEGTYYENVVIKDGVSLYGGFAGNEGLLNQRDADLHTTVLNGGMVTSVVTITNCLDARTSIDGFTITNGFGYKPWNPYGSLYYYGGGIYCRNSIVSITGNRIVGNFAGVQDFVGGYRGYGGGIFVQECPPGVIIRGNLITDNHTSWQGGGIAVYSCQSVLIERNVIRGNSVQMGGGGGIEVTRSQTTIVSNLIDNNLFIQIPGYNQLWSGAGIHVGANSVVSILNNTLFGNNADTDPTYSEYQVGGIMFYGWQDETVPTVGVVANNIIVGNSSGVCYRPEDMQMVDLTFSNNLFFSNAYFDYYGIEPGVGDFSQDPSLADPALGDFHVLSGSPCIDAGNNAYASASGQDLDGRPRIIDSVVDIGCYESDFTPPYTTASLSGNQGLNGWYLGPYVTVTLNADDGDGSGVDYTKYAYGTSGNFINYYGPFSYSMPGNNNLRYFSADRAGNAEPERITAIRFDKTLPSVTISSPAATTSYSRVTPAPFAGNAFDTVSGVLSVRWINAQGGSGTCAGTTSWTASVPLAQGSNRVTLWATDNAGNAKSTWRTITFDNIAPAATTTNPVNGATGVSRTAPNIRVNFSEAIAQGSAYGNVTLKKGKTNVAITKSIVGSRLNITPTAALSRNAQYTVTVPVSAVQDLAGNPLAVQKVFSFTTGN